MKFKKVMLITIMLLVVLTMSAVSASQNSNFDNDFTASENKGEIEVIQTYQSNSSDGIL